MLLCKKCGGDGLRVFSCCDRCKAVVDCYIVDADYEDEDENEEGEWDECESHWDEGGEGGD